MGDPKEDLAELWANIDYSGMEMRVAETMRLRALVGNPPLKPVDTGRMSFSKPAMYYGPTYSSRWPKD